MPRTISPTRDFGDLPFCAESKNFFMRSKFFLKKSSKSSCGFPLGSLGGGDFFSPPEFPPELFSEPLGLELLGF